MLTEEPDRPSQAEIAQELSMNENAVKQAFYRLRQRYRLLLREEIAHTVLLPAMLKTSCDTSLLYCKRREHELDEANCMTSNVHELSRSFAATG